LVDRGAEDGDRAPSRGDGEGLALLDTAQVVAEITAQLANSDGLVR